jgi:hypothetical protein
MSELDDYIARLKVRHARESWFLDIISLVELLRKEERVRPNPPTDAVSDKYLPIRSVD